jgi:PAS domain S-box-containing protein
VLGYVGKTDSVVVIDKRGIMRAVSKSCQKMFGYRQSQMVGLNVRKLMPSPYREQHDSYLEAYHRTGNAHILLAPRSEEVVLSVRSYQVIEC